MLTRRQLLSEVTVLGAYGGATRFDTGRTFAATTDLCLPSLPAGARGSAVLDARSGRKPLIKRLYRAPNCETPVDVFQQNVIPNDQFFVLKLAPGVDVVEDNCAVCDSLDMIQMNFPVRDAKGWRVTVGKMVHVKCAPISDLAANYSK